jgi:tRNA (guanine37-N1)-methyltransferase
VRLWNPRDFAEGNYRRVDDRPFGGGPGMVMLAEPLARCLAALAARDAPAPVVLFSPIGERWTMPAVEAGRPGAGAVLLCGRYEGIDQRFIDAHVDVQLSLGDFVLSGRRDRRDGLARRRRAAAAGVLNDPAATRQDSFNPAIDGLLDCPHYTRPEEWNGRRCRRAAVGPPCPDRALAPRPAAGHHGAAAPELVAARPRGRPPDQG